VKIQIVNAPTALVPLALATVLIAGAK